MNDEPDFKDSLISFLLLLCTPFYAITHIFDFVTTSLLPEMTLPRMLCNGNGAISHLQTEMEFVEDIHYSLYN